MKKCWLLCLMATTWAFSSCINEKDLYVEEPKAEVNTSTFSTEQQVTLDIDYSKAEAQVLFYIYDQNPLTFSDNSVSLNKSIQPLDAAWTNESGKYTGTMTLPAYVEDVYLVSDAFYARTLMKGTIQNGILKLTDTDETGVVSRAPSQSDKYQKGRFASLGWSTALGTYNSTTGVINYDYKGGDSKLTLTANDRRSLTTTISTVLKRSGDCPTEFRNVADLYIEKENTEIVLTSLGGNTCWNSSLGYYYYKTNQTPRSLSEVTVYTIFPNTQTSWINDTNKLCSYPQGVKEGDDVQLLYFANNDGVNGTTKFPAGYKIGFVLACNAWDTYFGAFDYGKTLGFYSSSTEGFSSAGKNNIGVHTAMFTDKKTGNIAIAFEDFDSDQNFTDVLFSVKANPMITNIPEVDDDKNTTITTTGIYAFEDMWPSEGDYDMNDVLAQYTYEKTFNNKDEILKESFTLKSFANTATLQNGLAINFLAGKQPGNYNEFIKLAGEEEFIPTEFAHNGNVITFTDNVKTNMNAEYKISVDYGQTPIKTRKLTVDAFIFRPSKNGQLEIHCPMMPPSPLADMSLFGTKNDCSDPARDIYYVSSEQNKFPFSFYLANATNEDIAPLLEIGNERTRIDELYPNFLNWATTGKNPDWYKKK